MPTLEETKQIRFTNLQQLLTYNFDQNMSRFADAIGRSHTYAWQLFHKHRTISEKTARLIEGKLGMESGALDKPLNLRVIKKQSEVKVVSTKLRLHSIQLTLEVEVPLPD